MINYISTGFCKFISLEINCAILTQLVFCFFFLFYSIILCKESGSVTQNLRFGYVIRNLRSNFASRNFKSESIFETLNSDPFSETLDPDLLSATSFFFQINEMVASLVCITSTYNFNVVFPVKHVCK